MKPAWEVDKSFNPFTQVFTIIAPDGVTKYHVTLDSVREIQLKSLYQGIGEASQLGAAALLLICLLLVTKSDKRRSWVFICNAIALLLVFIRSLLQCLVSTGPFYDWYRWQFSYYDKVYTGKALSISAEIFNFLLEWCIATSLTLQVRIVCTTLRARWRRLLNALMTFVAFAVVASRFGLMVLNINWNMMHIQDEKQWQFKVINKMGSACNILLVITIAISATIFCAKLGFAIQARRSMGMKQFGAMQIIFVIGCQTMCTPLLFNILTYFVIRKAQIQSFVPTVVALSLPLSAMWAAANTNNVHIATPDAQHHRILPIGRSNLGSGKAYGINATEGSATLVDDGTPVSTPTKRGLFSGNTSNGRDLEMGVHVDRTYSVFSEPAFE